MKVNMEVTEVLAPQFVVPVVAVVICALLVFMFGFKHAPEPTFEYDSSDDKKYKKSKGKKKEKTSQTNGHVVNIESNKVSSAGNQSKVTEKKEIQKPKPKKTPKAVVHKPEIVKENGQAEENADGWTTAVSKKDKKKSKRRDPEDILQGVKSEQQVEEMNIEQETINQLVKPLKPAGSTTVPKSSPPPQEQRSGSKKTPRSSKGKGPAIVQDGAVEKTIEEKVQDDSQSSEVVLENEEPQDANKQIQKSEVKTDDKEQVSSKKNKKKKKKEVAEILNFGVSPDSTETVKVPETKKLHDHPSDSIETQLAEAMRESPSPPATPNEPTPSKKTKKKQKGKKEETSSISSQIEASQVTDKLLTQEVSSATKVTLPDVSLKDQTNAIPTVQAGTLSASQTKQEDSKSDGATAVKTSTTGAAAGDTKATVAFDEMGEWQEAKPVKKRKKPRRDN